MDYFDFMFLCVMSLSGFFGGVFLFWINNIDNDIIPPLHYDPSLDSPSSSSSSKPRQNSPKDQNHEKQRQSSAKTTTPPAQNGPSSSGPDDAFMISSKPYRGMENIGDRYRAAAYSSDPFAHGLLPSASSNKSFFYNAPRPTPLSRYVLSALLVIVIWEFVRYCFKSLISRCRTRRASPKSRPTGEKQANNTPKITKNIVDDSPLAFTTMPKHRLLVSEPLPGDIPSSPTETLSRRQSDVIRRSRSSIKSDVSADSGYQTARSRLSSLSSTQSAVTNSPFRSFPRITPPSSLRLQPTARASLIPGTINDVFTTTAHNTHTPSIPRDTAETSAIHSNSNSNNVTIFKDISKINTESHSNHISAVLNKHGDDTIRVNSARKILYDVFENTTPNKSFLVETSGPASILREDSSCFSNIKPVRTPTPKPVQNHVFELPFQFKSSSKQVIAPRSPSLSSPATPRLPNTTPRPLYLSNSLNDKTATPNASSPGTRILTPLPPFVVARRRRVVEGRQTYDSPPSSTSSGASGPPTPSSQSSSPPVTYNQSPDSIQLRAILAPLHSTTSLSPTSTPTSSPPPLDNPSMPSTSPAPVPASTSAPIMSRRPSFGSPNDRFTSIERCVLGDQHLNPLLLNEASLSMLSTSRSAPSSEGAITASGSNSSNEEAPLPAVPLQHQPSEGRRGDGDREAAEGGEEEEDSDGEGYEPFEFDSWPKLTSKVYAGHDNDNNDANDEKNENDVNNDDHDDDDNDKPYDPFEFDSEPSSSPPPSLPTLPPRPKFTIYTGSEPSGASSSSSSTTTSSHSDDSSTRPLPGNDLQTLNENLLRRIRRKSMSRSKPPRLDRVQDENKKPKRERPWEDINHDDNNSNDNENDNENLNDTATAAVNEDDEETRLTNEEIEVQREKLMKRVKWMAEERRKRRMGIGLFTPTSHTREDVGESKSRPLPASSSIFSNNPDRRGRRVRFAETQNTIHVFEADKADNLAYMPTYWALSTPYKICYDEETGEEYTRDLTREEVIECEELDISIRLELNDLRSEMSENGTIVFLKRGMHGGCVDLGLSPEKSGKVDFSFDEEDEERDAFDAYNDDGGPGGCGGGIDEDNEVF